jgi:cobalt-zinc-cadmium efflux system protein
VKISGAVSDHEHHQDGHPHDGHHHDQGGHSHAISADADRRYLTIAFVLIVGLMAFEIVAGIVAHSLTLTYGRRRAEVLSGQANSAVLLVLGALVSYEAIWRLVTPPDVSGVLVTVVAAVGVGVNIVAAWVLAKANRENLNIEGSFQHIVTDLYAFAGTFVSGLVIVFTGFDRADAIASLIVAALMFKSGFQLQRKAIRVLLEGAPEGLSPSAIGMAMAHGAHVKEVHDLHVWELVPGNPLLTAHVLVAREADCHAVRRALEHMLKERFAIGHTTLQVDHAPDEVLSIRRRAVRQSSSEPN